MPSKKALSSVRQKRKTVLVSPHSPPPASPSSSSGDSHLSQSQGGDEDMATLGQILESMLKVSKDRRERRRKEVEGGYRDGFKKAERKAWAWLDGLRAREQRRQHAALTKLKSLLARKRDIEDKILAAVEAMQGACESFGEMLVRDTKVGLSMAEK